MSSPSLLADKFALKQKPKLQKIHEDNESHREDDEDEKENSNTSEDDSSDDEESRSSESESSATSSDDDDDDDAVESSSEESDRAGKSLDGDDLRRAGEYGQQLLQLLDKESRRAAVLAQLLEREQRRNSELLDKQTDLLRLQRRTTYQQQNLQELEQHTEALENTLNDARSELEKERRRRKDVESQVEKLRQMIDELEVEKPSKAIEPPSQKLNTAIQAGTPSNNQLDKTLSPQSNDLLHVSRLEEAIEAHRKLKSKPSEPMKSTENHQRSNQLHSAERSKESASSEKELLETAQTHLNDYHEVKQMYEEERERRQQLQSEIQALVEEFETKKCAEADRHGDKSNNHEFSPSTSIAVDIAIRALSQELGFKHNRRATIGTCKARSTYETPPSAQSGGNLGIRKTPVMYVSRKLEEEFATTRKAVQRGNCPAVNPHRKLHVNVLVGENESHATYVIQVETDQGWRMVQTRFRKFKYIHDWVKQHAQGGLLSLPAKLPGKGLMRGGSLSKRNMNKRRTWLEYTLQTVQREQPTLLDVLLDNISMLQRQQRRHSAI